ncbi:pantothenate kinase [Nostoc sp. NIES-2111]|nr:pantothenate kinase [Nostoc sp. NIES-2111]
MKSQQYSEHLESTWLALEIGNSRLHWALFNGESLECTWDTEYLPESVIQQLGTRGVGGAGSGEWGVRGDEEVGGDGGEFLSILSTLTHLPPTLQVGLRLHRRSLLQTKQAKDSSPSSSPTPSSPPTPLPLLLASVVPQQTALWQNYPNVRVITLDQIPLNNIYPTLGIDRALALWGAGVSWGFPILVIDAGTALTFTAADGEKNLLGGAILPGMGLQLASLGQKTGQLPRLEVGEIQSLPPRFALNTPEAMQSGVIYTLLAGIKDFVEEWWSLFPHGKVTIKGGDRNLLLNYLQKLYPAIASRLIIEPNLIFWGMQKIGVDVT